MRFQAFGFFWWLSNHNLIIGCTSFISKSLSHIGGSNSNCCYLISIACEICMARHLLTKES